MAAPHFCRESHKMSLLIKNGRVVTAVDDYHADIYIGNSHVDVIGKELTIEADRTSSTGPS